MRQSGSARRSHAGDSALDARRCRLCDHALCPGSCGRPSRPCRARGPLRTLSRFQRGGQRTLSVIPSLGLVRDADHGGQIPVVASAAQRVAMALSHSRDRGEADRARALLLTLAGWTSPRIAEAFGVREDTVRGSGAALSWRAGSPRCGNPSRRARSRSKPRRAPWRSPRRCCRDRSRIAPTGPCRGWPTRSRSAPACASRAQGFRSCCAKGDFRWRRPRHTLTTRQDAQRRGPRWPAPQAPEGAGRGGRYRALFGDESEALTHPYLADAWAKKGADLRIPAPGQAAEVAMRPRSARLGPA